MKLVSTPGALTCSECGEAVADAGYLPANEVDGGYDPVPGGAVCDECGFTAVGMNGCAPELGDVVDPDSADALLYVRSSGDGIEVVSAKE